MVHAVMLKLLCVCQGSKNPGPHARKASTLPIELSLVPQNLMEDFFFFLTDFKEFSGDD